MGLSDEWSRPSIGEEELQKRLSAVQDETARLESLTGSLLPFDPTRGDDANTLLATQQLKTPIEILMLGGNGITKLTKEEIEINKVLLPYFHKQQVSRVQTEIKMEVREAEAKANLDKMTDESVLEGYLKAARLANEAVEKAKAA